MAFNFSDKVTSRCQSNVLVVDALNVAFRWKHQGRNDFRYEYERTVKSLAQSYDCGRIIIAADWGSSSYRKKLLPTYKGDRKEKFKEQNEVERMAFEMFFEEFEETLELLAEGGMTVLRYKGVEADDLAAYLVKEKDYFEFSNIWLISSDRDWDLLIQDGVSRFSTVTRKETTMDNWQEHYEGVEPFDYITMKCLEGDKGDSVPGVPGIGPVKAKQLINQYGTVFDIYDAMPIASKYKYIQNLNEFGEQLLLNVELMDLVTYCEEAIGAENIEDIKEKVLG